MSDVIEVKRGDRAVTFTDQLLSAGTAIDCSGGTLLWLLRSVHTSGTITAAPGTIAAGTLGNVSYLSGTLDFATAGDYIQEWEVSWSNGQRITVPSSGYNVIRVVQDLNP